MTRRSVSNLLLLVLVGLTLGLVIRSCALAPESDALVSMDGFEIGELRHAAFRLDRPVSLTVEATGSFEGPAASALAVYGWIVRRGDREVVWQMTPETVTPGRGTLALAEAVLPLGEGVYDAYFTTFGDPAVREAPAGSLPRRVARLLRFGHRAWASDRSKWALRIDPVDPDDAHAHRLEGEDERDAALAPPDLLWAATPTEGATYHSFGFLLDAPVTVRIEATGEFVQGPADYGWLDHLSTGRRVWTMTEANTEPAGGGAKNRRFSGAFALAPGLYRAAFQSDRSHHPGGWNANPPLDPAAYGLFLYTDAPERIAELDPWARLPRLVEMTGLGDSAVEAATFSIADSVRTWIYAVGEMRAGSSYDYGWLVREGEPGAAFGTGETVWEMTYGQTRNAGGAERNRIEEAYVALAPGTYTLHFKTDDSHSPDRWRGGAPYHPERWGVTLFALSPVDAVAVTRTTAREAEASTAEAPSTEASTAPAEGGPGGLPVRLAPLGNGQTVRRTFTLERRTPLRIRAVGELVRTNRYDYGWITDDEADDVVWEMTRSNTAAAGGVDKNRVFDGTVTLPAGAYTVHFTTDDSHAYGDFGQGAPADPSAWGITVERAAPPDAPQPPAPPDLSGQVEMEVLAREAARMAEEVRRNAREQLEATRQRGDR